MVCRICLKKSEFEINIFDDNHTTQRIAVIIQKHFWFTPQPDDPISNLICLECWKKILDFHEFYETVEEAHRLYFENLEAQYKIKNEAETLITLNVEGNIEDDEYKDINTLCEAIESGKEEKIIEVLLESENDELCEDEGTDSDEVLAATKKKIYKKKVKKLTIPEQSNPTKNKIIKSKPKEKRSWSNPEADEIVRKYLNLNCDICGCPNENFREIVKHFQISHPTINAYIKCCGRKFSNRQRVVQHAYKHQDPNFFLCPVCNKGFASAYSLQAHKTAYHASEEELKFQCAECGKRFARKHLLDYHKAYHVPVEEHKFLCKICQKSYASEHLLKAHISMRHRHAPNVCHICAKTIRDKKGFEKHVRSHFEDSGPRIKCPHPGCDKYLKDDDNLKVHLRRHQQENLIWSCNECSKVVKSRTALISHKNYAHSNQVFSCNECDKTFKREITLKEHMAQHTGEPLYRCPFCTRTFNSNANMHSHKKKTHPVEWDLWRKHKTQSAQQKIVQET